MASDAGAAYRVGFGRVGITPPIGTELAGQFHPRFCTAVHDDLFVRAMVIARGRDACALVSCDLAAVPEAVVGGMRTLVEQGSELASCRCHVFATHTHTGPRAHAGLSREADAAVVAALPARCAAAVAEACAGLRPATLHLQVGALESTFNRRFVLRDGRTATHPRQGLPGVVGPEGPTDPQLVVLAARDADGRLLGALVNWACHPITVGHESVVSADYPGAIEACVRATVEPQAVCLFANGAAGDLCPFDWYAPERTPYGFAYMERLGRAIGAEVARVARGSGSAVEPCPIRSASRRLPLPLRAIDDAARTAGEALSGREEEVYRLERALLRERLAVSAVEEVEVSALCVGGLALVFHPAELFSAYGLQIKALGGGAPVAVVGYAGGYVGYLPTEEAFRRGGYETRLCRTSRFAPEAGRMLVATAAELLSSMRHQDG